MRRALRLALRMQRLELLLLLGATVLVLAASLLIAWQTRVVRAEQVACLASVATSLDGPYGMCPRQDETLQLLQQASAFAKVGTIGISIVLALFLGVPLVAREVEGRTAALAWSLSRSRGRWLAMRVVPVLGIVALACLALGIAGDVLTHAAPWVEGSDPGFEDWFSRGPQVAVRAVALFGMALLVGGLIGRQLAAILVTAMLTLALFVAVTLVMDGWMQSAAEPVAIRPDQIVSGKIYGSGLRNDATGELLDDQAAGMAGIWDDPTQLDEFGMPRGYTMVYWMVPSHRYGEFVLRESAIFGLVAVLGAAGAVWAVSGRRP